MAYFALCWWIRFSRHWAALSLCTDKETGCHAKKKRGGGGGMRSRGNKLIIKLRPMQSVWIPESLKRAESIQKGMTRAPPNIRPSVLSRPQQWTEPATRWAWPPSPSASGRRSCLPGRSGPLNHWRSCTFQWNRPPVVQSKNNKKEKKNWNLFF